MQIRPLDITIALKTINLVDGLSATDKRVAGALLDHFNLKTSRCDPGLERLAGLLAVHPRTVIRSVHRLEQLGLFRKYRHGGYSNRNSYEPIWPRFREIEAIWTVRFRQKARQSEQTNVSPAGCRTSHVSDDNPVTQTSLTNQSNRTSSKKLPSKEFGEARRSSVVASQQQSADASRIAAERRWSNALHAQFAHFPFTYSEIVEAVDPELAAAATDAELQRRGAGVNHIIKSLRLGHPRVAAQGSTPIGLSTEHTTQQAVLAGTVGQDIPNNVAHRPSVGGKRPLS